MTRPPSLVSAVKPEPSSGLVLIRQRPSRVARGRRNLAFHGTQFISAASNPATDTLRGPGRRA